MNSPLCLAVLEYLKAHPASRETVVSTLVQVLPEAILKIAFAGTRNLWHFNSKISDPSFKSMHFETWVFWEGVYWDNQGFFSEEEVQNQATHELIIKGACSEQVFCEMIDDSGAEFHQLIYTTGQGCSKTWKQDFEVFFEHLILNQSIPEAHSLQDKFSGRL